MTPGGAPSPLDQKIQQLIEQFDLREEMKQAVSLMPQARIHVPPPVLEIIGPLT